MKFRVLIIVGAAIAAMSSFTVPAAAASTPPTPVPVSSQRSHSSQASPDQDYAFTLCLNTDNSQCLNLTDCDVANDVQTYDFSTGGTCSQDWYVSAIGHVGTSGFNPFWCGDDLNATYYGDTVFQVFYTSSSGGPYAPLSSGNSAAVYVTPQLETYYEGYWVAADNSNLQDTRLIDTTTSCNNGGTVEYVYAGCKGNGCRVRETHAPGSLLYWAWVEQEF